VSKQVSRKQKSEPDQQHIAVAKLDKLVEEATVDCYNESEAITGLYTAPAGSSHASAVLVRNCGR
jgi:hypothetical protein